MNDSSQGLSRLMDVIVGSSAGAVLVAALDLGVIPLLSGHPQGLTATEVGKHLGLDQRSSTQLLTAMACMGLVVPVDGRYRASELSARHLLPGALDYIGGLAEFIHTRSWDQLGRLSDHLRGSAGRAEDQETLYDPGDEALRRFWSGVHPLSRAAGHALPRLLGLSGGRRLLDVGGGTGGFASGFCQSLNDSRATVFELPFVAEIARSSIDREHMGHAVDVVAGDFFVQDLPSGHDTVALVNVLHNWGPEQVAELLTKCHKALDPGGTIAIVEHLVPAAEPESVTSALVGLLMVIQTEEGRTYTAEEHLSTLSAAGFTDARAEPFPGQAIASHVVIANRN
ncbi:methyltransferase [Nonomuraea sp. NPDC050404]|uniref:methyltransferase n=1 Tax=Nonomuraea sp. NPDC050404 TaxID=3155783 RepID=UPI0033CEF5BA